MSFIEEKNTVDGEADGEAVVIIDDDAFGENLKDYITCELGQGKNFGPGNVSVNCDNKNIIINLPGTMLSFSISTKNLWNEDNMDFITHLIYILDMSLIIINIAHRPLLKAYIIMMILEDGFFKMFSTSYNKKEYVITFEEDSFIISKEGSCIVIIKCSDTQIRYSYLKENTDIVFDSIVQCDLQDKYYFKKTCLSIIDNINRQMPEIQTSRKIEICIGGPNISIVFMDPGFHIKKIFFNPKMLFQRSVYESSCFIASLIILIINTILEINKIQFQPDNYVNDVMCYFEELFFEAFNSQYSNELYVIKRGKKNTFLISNICFDIKSVLNFVVSENKYYKVQSKFLQKLCYLQNNDISMEGDGIWIKPCLSDKKFLLKFYLRSFNRDVGKIICLIDKTLEIQHSESFFCYIFYSLFNKECYKSDIRVSEECLISVFNKEYYDIDIRDSDRCVICCRKTGEVYAVITEYNV